MNLEQRFRLLCVQIGEEKMEDLLKSIQDKIDVPRKYKIVAMNNLYVDTFIQVKDLL